MTTKTTPIKCPEAHCVGGDIVLSIGAAYSYDNAAPTAVISMPCGICDGTGYIHADPEPNLVWIAGSGPTLTTSTHPCHV